MHLPHKWVDIFIPMTKANLSFSFGLHFCVTSCCMPLSDYASESSWNFIQHACIMFNIYTGYLVTNTCQILANMFSNSTQHLAAVHSYFNLPIVWSQFSSISLHLCALIALFTRLFELQLDESTLDCVVSTECGHFGLKYTLRRVPASRYIVAFVYYFVWELWSVGFKWEHASL